MLHIKSFLALLLFFTCSYSTFAQSQPDTMQISLLTCGPGDELHAVFGHTAIRVTDSTFGFDVVYNFGTFDFETEYFYLKFIKGDLQYFASVDYYKDFLAAYRQYNRNVYEQVLNLTPGQKRNIAQQLAMAISPENRFYYYKFIDQNCTTMVADVINKNIEGSISMQNPDENKTNREIIYNVLKDKFFENLGINLMFGLKTDVTMYKEFLPYQLMEGVANTNLPNGKNLARPAKLVVERTSEGFTAPWWDNFYIYALICLLLMFISRNNTARYGLVTIFGLTGLFLCLVGFYSFHKEVSQNYNALLINPLLLLLLYFSVVKKRGLARITGFLILILIGFYIIILISKPQLLMMLPLIALIVILVLGSMWPKHKAVHK